MLRIGYGQGMDQAWFRVWIRHGLRYDLFGYQRTKTTRKQLKFGAIRVMEYPSSHIQTSYMCVGLFEVCTVWFFIPIRLLQLELLTDTIKSQKKWVPPFRFLYRKKRLSACKTVLDKACGVSKYRLPNSHTCSSDYLKYLWCTCSFQSDYRSLIYQSSTYPHHLEASCVGFGHSKKFIDRRYAVLNSIHGKTVVSKLDIDLLCTLLRKMKSVETGCSAIFNHLQTVQ